MARNTATRGRPKGTGVDDGARLIAIADLLAANPGMKPTTAIKSLGVTDPSVIRRLRDKYNLAGVPAPKPEAAAPQRRKVAALRSASPSVLKQAPARRAPRNPAPARPVESTGSSKAAPEPYPVTASSLARPDLFTAMFAASVSAAQVAFQLQLKTMSLAFQASPLACIARGQEFMRLVSAAYPATPAETRCSRP